MTSWLYEFFHAIFSLEFKLLFKPEFKSLIQTNIIAKFQLFHCLMILLYYLTLFQI